MGLSAVLDALKAKLADLGRVRAVTADGPRELIDLVRHLKRVGIDVFSLAGPTASHVLREHYRVGALAAIVAAVSPGRADAAVTVGLARVFAARFPGGNDTPFRPNRPATVASKVRRHGLDPGVGIDSGALRAAIAGGAVTFRLAPR